MGFSRDYLHFIFFEWLVNETRPAPSSSTEPLCARPRMWSRPQRDGPKTAAHRLVSLLKSSRPQIQQKTATNTGKFTSSFLVSPDARVTTTPLGFPASGLTAASPWVGKLPEPSVALDVPGVAINVQALTS